MMPCLKLQSTTLTQFCNEYDNTLRPRQDGRQSAEFQIDFLVWKLLWFHLNFIDVCSYEVHIMAGAERVRSHYLNQLLTISPAFMYHSVNLSWHVNPRSSPRSYNVASESSLRYIWKLWRHQWHRNLWLGTIFHLTTVYIHITIQLIDNRAIKWIGDPIIKKIQAPCYL